MINDEYIELINKKIDGLLSPNEDKKLNTAMENEPDIREYHDQLQQSLNLLNDLEELSPPAHMKMNIMNSLDQNLYGPKLAGKENNIWSLIFNPVPKMGVSFAAGLMIGIFLFALYTNRQILNDKDLYGTIGITENENFSEITTIPLNSDNLNGLLTVKDFYTKILIDVDVQKINAGELLIDYDPSQLILSSYQNIDLSGMDMMTGAREIRLFMNHKSQSQLIFNKLQGSSVKINFQMTASDELVVDKSVEIK